MSFKSMFRLSVITSSLMTSEFTLFCNVQPCYRLCFEGLTLKIFCMWWLFHKELLLNALAATLL